MAKAWENKKAVMKDLAKLGYVAVGINDCIHEKPPPCMRLEDTEEDYYRQWSGGAPSGDGPDLKVISEMLSLRHDVKKDDKEDTKGFEENGDGDDNRGSVELSKLNACATEFIPKPATNLNHNKLSQIEMDKMQSELREKINCPLQTNKGKRERVVAIASLIKVMSGEKPIGYDKTPQETNKPIRLLKPIDFIKKTTNKVEISVVDSIDQQLNKTEPNSLTNVTEWLDGPTRKEPVMAKTKKEAEIPAVQTITNIEKSDQQFNKTKKTSLTKVTQPELLDETARRGPMKLFTSASGMFKKKSGSPKNTVSPKTVEACPVSCSKKFVPSERCYSLFKEFEEKVASEEMVEQTMWTKAINIMKEKDTKMQQTEQFSLVFVNGVEKKFPSIICLPQPRHTLTKEDCVVCTVLCTKPM